MKRKVAIAILMLVSFVMAAPQYLSPAVTAQSCQSCLQGGQDSWFAAYFWCREQNMEIATCIAVADAVRCNYYKSSGCAGCEGVPVSCNWE